MIVTYSPPDDWYERFHGRPVYARDPDQERRIAVERSEMKSLGELRTELARERLRKGATS